MIILEFHATFKLQENISDKDIDRILDKLFDRALVKMAEELNAEPLEDWAHIFDKNINTANNGKS